MLVIDDILLFPLRGMMLLFREIQNAAREEVAYDAEAIRSELTELYMMLETGRITEEQFDAREKQLLDRLEQIENSARSTPSDSTIADR